jgi:glycosyltransferase involved in cell wall biosynthesis
MKIAFLSTFYPFRGGIAQFNGALFRSLEKEHEVRAFNFTTQYPSFLFPGKTQFVAEDDKADKIPSVRVLNSMNPGTYGQTVKRIKEFEPDMLIIGYWMPYMAPSLGYVAGKMQKHCRVVSIVHNAIPHENGKLDKQLSAYFFKRNTKCVALSTAVERDILNKFPSIATRVLLHPVYEHFGVRMDKVEALEHLSIPKEKKHILFFGLIREYKGLDLLLDAMALLPKDYDLTIAGEVYGSFDVYQRQIDRLNLKNRVHLHLRYIPDDEVKVFFSLADVVALPYKSATQSGIVAIAKHFEKPVVATNVGGLSEFIKHPSDGILTLAKTSESIASSIIEVTQQETEKINNSSSPYSWDEFARDLVEFTVDNTTI